MKINRVLISALFVAMVLVLTTFPQSYLEQQVFIGRDVTPVTNLWLQGKVHEGDHVGYFGWVQTYPRSDGYLQIYGGPYVDVKGFQFGLGVGAERSGTFTPRYAGFISTTQKKFFLNGNYERSRNGQWYLVQAGIQASKRFAFSYHDQYDFGRGPRVDVGIGKGFSVYAAPLWSPTNGSGVLTGVRYSFSFPHK